MKQVARSIKRISDIGVSAAGLLLLSPLFLFLGLWVKASSKGPVFFIQERIGKDGVPFDLYKFRTMNIDAEKDGPQLSFKNDPRITKAGKFIRRYHLDELPQLWNVLKGEMSIVGPRPEREYYIKQIIKKEPRFRELQRIRPGVTSRGSVKYGYASSIDQMVQRGHFDLSYLDNMSITEDMKIIGATVRAVLAGKGI